MMKTILHILISQRRHSLSSHCFRLRSYVTRILLSVQITPVVYNVRHCFVPIHKMLM